MLANTKQVRKILRIFNINATWTEKSRVNKDNSVRIIVDATSKEKYEEVKQAFADLGYTNEVYYTGGMWLRVKTFIA